MTNANQMTEDEWEHLRRTLEAVTNAVMIADPGGVTQEKLAINHGWAEAPNRFPRNEFVYQLFSTTPDELHLLNERKNAHPGAGVEQTISDAVEMCRQATELIKKNVPEEQQTFRSIVIFLAENVARASKEGGFLGIGGKQICDAEKAVIDRMIAVLPAP
jgi:hypothetical protein